MDRRWLKSIVRALMSNTNAEVLGVCGRLQSVGRGVVARYFAAQGHGMPTAVRMNIDQPIVLRLFAYMYTRLVGPHMPADGVEVREVPGGNAVFESELLKKVHGWDSNLKNAAEDNDLCRRLKHVRPNGVFLYCGGATIRHHDNISVSRLILRARTRGKVAAQYYSKHNVFPPIFPFPVLVIAILTVPFIYLSAWTLLLAICSPIIVYFWWLFRAFKESTWELMLFSYIEFLEQFFSNIGILQFSVLKIVNKRRKIRDI